MTLIFINLEMDVSMTYEVVNFSEKDVYTMERYYRQSKSKD